MSCRAIESWSFCGLVAAYLDVALAFLLFCGATLAFLAAKSLALLGLALPCPSACRHAPLLDAPIATLTALHLSLRSRPPFHAIFPDDKPPRDDAPAPTPLSARRCRHTAPPSPSSFSPSCQPRLPPLPPLLSRDDGFSESSCRLSPSSDPCNNIDLDEEKVALISDARDVDACKEDLVDVIRSLERVRASLCLELEKERSAASTAADEAMAMILRLQREKATIEMEARQYRRMIEEKAMYDEEEMEILKEIIVRREREKHVSEKEVEEYRRMVFSSGRLGKQMVRLMGPNPGTPFNSSDDPVPMLQKISVSVGEKENDGSKNEFIANGSPAVAEFTHKPTIHGDVKFVHSIHNHHLEPADFCDASNINFQEKCMVNMDGYTPSLHPSLQSQRVNYDETLQSLEEGVENVRNGKVEMVFACNDICREDNQDVDQRGSDSSHFDHESSAHDVHVVSDKLIMGVAKNRKERDLSQMGCASITAEKGGSPLESSGIGDDISLKDLSITNLTGVDLNIHRSCCSDLIKGSPFMDYLSDKVSAFDLRRSSTSVFGSEKFKLETEVGLLRKKLKIIQDGRENLSFSLERREKESLLELLEEIASQLQVIRIMMEPRKSVRQASSPPSYKAKPVKRRCRSVPWELRESM